MFCEKCKKNLKNTVLLYLCVSNISVFGATTGAPYRVGATKMRSSSEAEAICDVYIYIIFLYFWPWGFPGSSMKRVAPLLTNSFNHLIIMFEILSCQSGGFQKHKVLTEPPAKRQNSQHLPFACPCLHRCSNLFGNALASAQAIMMQSCSWASLRCCVHVCFCFVFLSIIHISQSDIDLRLHTPRPWESSGSQIQRTRKQIAAPSHYGHKTKSEPTLWLAQARSLVSSSEIWGNRYTICATNGRQWGMAGKSSKTKFWLGKGQAIRSDEFTHITLMQSGW